jgi:hypothetical protein
MRAATEHASSGGLIESTKPAIPEAGRRRKRRPATDRASGATLTSDALSASHETPGTTCDGETCHDPEREAMRAGTKRWSTEEHEAGLALFIAPDWRPRFRTILAMNPAKRHKQLDKYLYHFEWNGRLDDRFARGVEPMMFGRLLPILQAKGAQQMCYVVSTDDDLDGREIPLDETLEFAIESGPHNALVSCVPGRLGFFYDYEDDPYRWVLERTEGG